MAYEEIAGHRFTDGRLAQAALTHSSYLHEHPEEEHAEDFERLEFLGDAVVDLVIGEELYRRFPDATEGELTALRAQLVSSAALAPVATRLGLTERVRLGRGEEDTGGRARPGLAASVFESVVGAVYLDADLETARTLIRRTMAEELAEASAEPRRSPKTVLQEWAQASHQPLPTYRVVEETGPEHRRDFVIEVSVGDRVARGTGASKREAQEAAATKLLEEVTR